MDSTLTRLVSRDVRPAMELIYGLRECGVEKDIDIPQVAVIGDQSSGKSSVLESICSLPLPRGAGLTTKCAIELRLTDSRAYPTIEKIPAESADHSDPESPWRASISTSINTTPVSVFSTTELEREIEARAEQLTDPQRAGGFSRERIIVDISAPGAPNLTLIDLPGIIRTKTFGDFFPSIPFMDSQEKSAIREVTKLIQDYIKQERTILLVVIPCTQDVATIEALEWAARQDPTGQRTIGVLTKPDLVDDGAEPEVAAVLANRRKPLNLGYVMLKNRSQREVLDRVSVSVARHNEAQFFSNHKIFSTMDSNLFGVENLIKKITAVLVSRIYDALPSMRSEITTKLDRTVSDLAEVGFGAGETPAEASMTLMRVVFEYNNLVVESAAGRYVQKKLWDPKLRMCTRVRELYDELKKDIENTRPKFEEGGGFIAEIEAEIRGSRGRELPGFLNPRIFESRVARYVETWRPASSKLLGAVRKLVGEVAHDLFTLVSPEFPGLRNKMHDVIADALKGLEESARDEIDAVFKREIGQPFTLNEQFLSSVNAKRLDRFDAAVVVALSRAGHDNRGNARDKDVAKLLRAWYQSYYCSGSTQRVRAEAEDMTTMLSCYWDVAADRFVDNHVMALDTSVIRPLAQAIHVPMNELVLKVGNSEEALAALLKEDPELVRKRKELIAQRGRLTQARDLIDRF